MVIVTYLPPFDVIKQSVELSTQKGQLTATASYDGLIGLIKQLLSGINVDEIWYSAKYPDIAEAINNGKVASAKQHFIDNGYFEGRLPFDIVVDDDWYKSQYPDVADSISSGAETSSQIHFNRDGYKEGRLPFAV